MGGGGGVVEVWVLLLQLEGYILRELQKDGRRSGFGGFVEGFGVPEGSSTLRRCTYIYVYIYICICMYIYIYINSM